MPQELIYTSAANGLKPGSKGFCTVAATSGMSKPISDLLESLSGYRHIHPAGSKDALRNPVQYSFVTANVGGKPLYVLSRVADAGLDYSGRSNKLAHHIVLDESELMAAGPAAMLACSGTMFEEWNRAPQLLSKRYLPIADADTSEDLSKWKDWAGDDGWAMFVLENVRRKTATTLIYPEHADCLSLLVQAERYLSPSERWKMTFSTFTTQVSPQVNCLVRFSPDGQKEAHAARLQKNTNVVDMVNRSPAPPVVRRTKAGRTKASPPTRTEIPNVPIQLAPIQEPLDVPPPGAPPTMPTRPSTFGTTDASVRDRQAVVSSRKSGWSIAFAASAFSLCLGFLLGYLFRGPKKERDLAPKLSVESGDVETGVPGAVGDLAVGVRKSPSKDLQPTAELISNKNKNAKFVSDELELPSHGSGSIRRNDADLTVVPEFGDVSAEAGVESYVVAESRARTSLRIKGKDTEHDYFYIDPNETNVSIPSETPESTLRQLSRCAVSLDSETRMLTLGAGELGEFVASSKSINLMLLETPATRLADLVLGHKSGENTILIGFRELQDLRNSASPLQLPEKWKLTWVHNNKAKVITSQEFKNGVYSFVDTVEPCSTPVKLRVSLVGNELSSFPVVVPNELPNSKEFKIDKSPLPWTVAKAELELSKELRGSCFKLFTPEATLNVIEAAREVVKKLSSIEEQHGSSLSAAENEFSNTGEYKSLIGTIASIYGEMKRGPKKEEMSGTEVHEARDVFNRWNDLREALRRIAKIFKDIPGVYPIEEPSDEISQLIKFAGSVTDDHNLLDEDWEIELVDRVVRQLSEKYGDDPDKLSGKLCDEPFEFKFQIRMPLKEQDDSIVVARFLWESDSAK